MSFRTREISDLMVITKAKDLSKYVFVICEGAPKKFRLSLIARLQNLSLDIISKLYEANETFIEMNLIKDIDKSIEGISKIDIPKSETEKLHLQNKLLQLKLTRATKFEERVAKRLDASYRALTLLKEFDHVCVVAKEMQCVTFHQYQELARQIFDVQNLLGAFIKSDKKRFNYA